MLAEIAQSIDAIKRGKALPKRWMTISIDTAGPQWEMQQLDVLRTMQPREIYREIRAGIEQLKRVVGPDVISQAYERVASRSQQLELSMGI